MKQAVIVGTGVLGKIVRFYLEKDASIKVVGYCANKEYITCESFDDLPIYPLEELSTHIDINMVEVYIAIGNNKMNNLRKKVYEECKQLGYQIGTFIHSSTITNGSEVGEGSIILERCIIYPYTKIGLCNLLWDNICISHDNFIGDFNTFSSFASTSGFSVLGNNCYIGKFSMIYEFVKVADYTLAGAGSHVKRDTKPYDVVVPARSITLDNHKSTDLM